MGETVPRISNVLNSYSLRTGVAVDFKIELWKSKLWKIVLWCALCPLTLSVCKFQDMSIADTCGSWNMCPL